MKRSSFKILEVWGTRYPFFCKDLQGAIFSVLHQLLLTYHIVYIQAKCTCNNFRGKIDNKLGFYMK